MKLACRDTNDLKALNRSEQAAGCRLHAAKGDGSSTYQHCVLSTHLEPGLESTPRRVWVKPLQVSLARCVRNNLHSHQEFINCLWQLHSTHTSTATPTPCISCSCTFRFPILPQSVAVRRHNLIKPAGLTRPGEKHQCSRLDSGTFSELPAPRLLATYRYPLRLRIPDNIPLIALMYFFKIIVCPGAPAYHKLCKWKNANRKKGFGLTTILN